MSQRIWHGGELARSGDDSLVSFALESGARFSDRAALIDAPTGATTTFGELSDRMLRVASSLADTGLRPGEVVATLTANSSHWVIFALGVMAAGGMVTGMNPALTAQEISAHLARSGAVMLAVSSALLPSVEAAGLDALVRHVVVLDSDAVHPRLSLAGLIRDGRPQPRRPSPDDVCLLAYSSGTSGLPKGVEVTGRSLALSAASGGQVLELSERDVWLAVAPFFHIVAVSGVLASGLAYGVPIVILPAPDLEAMLAAVERHRVTVTVLTPPVIRALAVHPAVGRHDLSSLRALGCTAAPLSAEHQVAAARRIGTTVFQAYGMTETIGAVALGPLSDTRPGSCGQVTPTFEVRIVDPETGCNRDPGVPGEIWIRSPIATRGYRGDPAATAEISAGDGWLRTGDIGHVDADGYLFVVDRLKELIKVNSSQVAPAELEALVAAYPGVADVAVVGRPSAQTGECPVAYVVAVRPLDAAGLMAWVGERVAPFKQLGAVEFVDSIPRQPNGKIMRRLLRDRERNTSRAPVA